MNNCPPCLPNSTHEPVLPYDNAAEGGYSYRPCHVCGLRLIRIAVGSRLPLCGCCFRNVHTPCAVWVSDSALCSTCHGDLEHPGQLAPPAPGTLSAQPREIELPCRVCLLALYDGRPHNICPWCRFRVHRACTLFVLGTPTYCNRCRNEEPWR